MTPKDKAQELVNKYSNQLEHIARIADEWSMSEFSQFRQIIAAKCALIAVDEIMNVIIGSYDYELEKIYWQEVKQEIENL